MSSISEWLQLAERVEHVSKRFAFLRVRSDGNDVSRVHRIGYGLVARSASAFKGTVILVRATRIVEARIVARSCVEDALYLNALIKDGEDLVNIIEKADAKGRETRGKFMLNQPRVILDDATRTKLLSFLTTIRQDGPRIQLPTPKSVSKDTPFEHLYLVYSQMSDDAGHPSLSSLGRYVHVEDERVILDFSPSVTKEELVDTLTWGCLSAIGCLVAGSQLFDDAGLNHHATDLALAYERLANPPRSA